MKLHRKYLDANNLLNSPRPGLNYIKINKSGVFATNGNYCINFPLENPDEFTFDTPIFISAEEAQTILKLIPKSFTHIELLQEEGKFFVNTSVKEMKIPIKNDVTDFNYPNTDKYINMYSDQKPKLSITFDAIYIKLLAEQLIKFNGIKEFQPRMEFNFYDLENLEKAVEINLIKDKISKVNIVLMPLKLE